MPAKGSLQQWACVRACAVVCVSTVMLSISACRPGHVAKMSPKRRFLLFSNAIRHAHCISNTYMCDTKRPPASEEKSVPAACAAAAAAATHTVLLLLPVLGADRQSGFQATTVRYGTCFGFFFYRLCQRRLVLVLYGPARQCRTCGLARRGRLSRRVVFALATVTVTAYK